MARPEWCVKTAPNRQQGQNGRCPHCGRWVRVEPSGLLVPHKAPRQMIPRALRGRSTYLRD